MQKLKEYKYIILIALVILGFVFYWYEIRVSKIYSSCSRKISNIIKENPNLERDGIEVFYNLCIRAKGLNK